MVAGLLEPFYTASIAPRWSWTEMTAAERTARGDDPPALELSIGYASLALSKRVAASPVL